MNNSLLFQYLKILDKKERRELGRFVLMPFHNAAEGVVRLYEYVENQEIPPSVNLDKKAVFKAVFPQKNTFDDVLLRQTMSALTQLVRDFLVWRTLKNETATADLLLIKALQERQAERLLEKEMTDAFAALERQPFRHTDYHRQKFDLLVEESKILNRRKRGGDLRLQEMHDELTQFYVGELLRQSATMRSHQSMTQRQYEQPLLSDILKKIETDFQQRPPFPIVSGFRSSTVFEDKTGVENTYSIALSAYYFAYRALGDDGQTDDFQQLKNIIVTHWALFPAEELRDLYLLAINFCIKRLNRGIDSFNREALDLPRHQF